jgi:Protein of unknown function (DUF2934)
MSAAQTALTGNDPVDKTPPALAALENTTPTQPATYEEVARLAYAFWEARGYIHGYADEDWFRAEQELAEIRVAGASANA